MNEIEIIPAILPKDFHELEDKVSYINGNADTVQIDICDGQFVQNATWPYRKNDDSFGMLLKEEIGLPAWENLNYEIDLMVNHPEEVIEDWIIAGANRIILHEESDGSIQGAIEAIDNRVEVGLAFNIDSEIVFREGISSIQLMGIDRIGFQGQEYDPRVLEKIKEARMIYPELPISVDGAVSLKNAEALINAGADRLVVGSAIFNTDNILESLEQFHEIVEG